MKYHYTSVNIAKTKNSHIIKCWQLCKETCIFIAGKIENYISTLKNNSENYYKLNLCTHTILQLHTLAFIPEYMNTYVQTKTCI